MTTGKVLLVGLILAACNVALWALIYAHLASLPPGTVW